MIYLFQTTCYAALLFGIYLLFLRNRATHAWSRAWLLTSAVLPFAIPFITLPGLSNGLPRTAQRYLVILPEATVIAAPLSKGGNAYPWLALAYAAIAALLLGRALMQYLSLRRFINAHTAQLVDDIKVVYDKNTEPGSFGRYIFLPGTDSDAAIFQHEQAHIKLRHSADILLMRLLGIFFWPNVMLYVITRELRLVHEFQADAHSSADKQRYISTLLGAAFHTSRFSFTHTFFHHPLKRRIMMLQRSSPNSAKVRMIAFKTCSVSALLIAGIICLQSCERKADPVAPAAKQAARNGQPTEDLAKMTTPPSPDRIADEGNVVHTADGRDIYKSVDHAPKPSYDLPQYLAANIKYPASAKAAGKEGRAIVKFVIDEEGRVADVKVLNNVDPALTAEAIRVVSNMPKWQPGEHQGKKVAVYFHLPILFRLK